MEDSGIMSILLSLLTFAILRVSQHIYVDAGKGRVTKVEQRNTLVCVWCWDNTGMNQQSKTCQPHPLKRHQQHSEGAEEQR